MVKLAKPYKVDKAYAALSALQPEVSLFVGFYSVQITLPVKSMKHMTEVLEYMERTTSLTCDTTEDAPYSATRAFMFGHNGWLRVNATVSTDPTDTTATCHRHQTGVVMVEQPVYKLVCAD